MIELSLPPPPRSQLLAIGLTEACCTDLTRIFGRAGVPVHLERLPAGATVGECTGTIHDGTELVIATEHALRAGTDDEFGRIARLAPLAVLLSRYTLSRAAALTRMGACDVLTCDELERLVASLLRERRSRESRRRLSAFSGHLESAREDERERIARDIHDELGGKLVAVKIEASLLAARLDGDPVQLRTRVRSIEDLLDDAIATASRVSRELRPGILKDFGLGAAIECQAEDFTRRTGIPCAIRCVAHDIEPPLVTSIGVFRIFQEALTNVCKHAHASSVEVRLTGASDGLVLEVSDDGLGLSPGDLDKPRSFGLRGMRERAAGLGGWLELHPRRPRGTRLRLSMPFEAREPAHGLRSVLESQS